MKKPMLITVIVTVVALVLVHIFASREMHFNEEVLINKNVDEVWDVLGNQFAEADVWSSNFKTSQPGGDPKLPGLAYLHRETTTAKGVSVQELDTFNPANYSLTYHVSKGVPPIAKSALGEWSLTKVSDNQTRMNVHFILETKGLLGLVMSPVLSKKVGQASNEIVEEFKYYLENGKPHPRKLESL